MTPDYIRAGPFLIVPDGVPLPHVEFPLFTHAGTTSIRDYDAFGNLLRVFTNESVCAYCKTISRAERCPSCGAGRRG